MITTLRLVKLSDSPRLYQVDDFLSDEEIAHILRITADEADVGRRGIHVKRDFSGLSFELPIAGDRVLEEARARIERCVGFDNDFAPTFRYRRYRTGEYHPAHRDIYRIGDRHLVTTMLLYLCDTEAGGETFFPDAAPSPIEIRPRKGRLVFWFNYRVDGTEDPSAQHESVGVAQGEKITLTSSTSPSSMHNERSISACGRSPPIAPPGSDSIVSTTMFRSRRRPSCAALARAGISNTSTLGRATSTTARRDRSARAICCIGQPYPMPHSASSSFFIRRRPHHSTTMNTAFFMIV
jgi:2OG-Fe(II) oxygenase superfamily